MGVGFPSETSLTDTGQRGLWGALDGQWLFPPGGTELAFL